ncbi:MAG: MarR family EPS-associated transcriptional regulator [Acidobacteria bacterium]|nr:MarR family EPS-associated transcriptional regulator [Acidobacteriota bacterium]MBV9070990.1 MarR family EPS-associated transcriptional regulator [Acidobacteriota bacterium]MBV9184518.1 MarR family EPS-associated transcriptional regulator [Acidobacteriota bacterium]
MNERRIPDEVRYGLLKYLEQHPDASQRDLARELGVSVGKINYCVRALTAKGLVKADAFKNSRNKSAYMYVLTPKGIEAKIQLTYEFLRWKITEHDILLDQIEALRREIKSFDGEENSATEQPA